MGGDDNEVDTRELPIYFFPHRNRVKDTCPQFKNQVGHRH